MACSATTAAALIHTIGRNYPAQLHPWIEQRIFPGACPPALSEMTQIFEPWDLSVLDVENLRLHYARTLLDWLSLFETNVDRVRGMFDEKFVRMWRLYLAGFRGGLHERHAATVPGAVRDLREQQHRDDPRSSLPPLGLTARVIHCDVLIIGGGRRVPRPRAVSRALARTCSFWTRKSFRG